MHNPQSIIKEAATIYFVCSGNIIRSSFAEILAKHLDKSNSNIKSYGTTYHNSQIHQKSAEELQRRGVPSKEIKRFSPTHMTEIEFDDNDVHIVMTSDHRNQLVDHGITPDRIFSIKSLIGEEGDVEDPYFAGNYKEAYNTIAKAVGQILDNLSPNL